jgi:hypothetical protein
VPSRFPRLARMPRPALRTLSLALAVAAALALAACGGGGGSDQGLLPGKTADQIVDNLNAVETLFDEGQCDQATEKADLVVSQVESLPESVKPKLRQVLHDGAVRLQEKVASDCEPAATTAPATVPETTESTTESASTESTKETTKQTTESTATTPTETTTQTTTQPTTTQAPPPTTPGGGSGGIGPGGVAGKGK